jgi:hypothetical protein
MRSFAVIALIPLTLIAANEGTPSKSTAEFNKRWNNARKLAVAVAEVMPPAQYAFRPDPGSMSFGEQLSHIAQANYAFGDGLKDSNMTPRPAPDGKDAIVKFLGDSFDYLSLFRNRERKRPVGDFFPASHGRGSETLRGAVRVSKRLENAVTLTSATWH